MAKFYANMIVKGTRTYEQAPDILKEAGQSRADRDECMASRLTRGETD